ncbi:MAG: hypothetical protein J5927_07495 [Oscillospiraceae bacterium]|nr:hypothetical protein [Oscillospiraceae bacterium]
MNSRIRETSFRLAFGALMAAMGTALMMAGGLIPAATYCSPLLAGVLLLPVLSEGGTGAAWSVWTATALLSLIVCPDKEAAAMYLCLGYYPIVKPVFDRLRPRPLGFLAKLLFFALALGLMYALLCMVLQLEAVLAEFREASLLVNLLLYLALMAVMLLYDFSLGKLWLLYQSRLRPRLKRSRPEQE